MFSESPKRAYLSHQRRWSDKWRRGTATLVAIEIIFNSSWWWIKRNLDKRNNNNWNEDVHLFKSESNLMTMYRLHNHDVMHIHV